MRMLLPQCVIVPAISHQPVDNQFNLGKVVNLKTATWAINLANYMLDDNWGSSWRPWMVFPVAI